MQPKRRIITDGVLSAIVLRRVAPASTVMGRRRWSDWRGLCFVLSDKLLGGRYPALVSKLHELNALRAQIAQKSLAVPDSQGLEVHQQRLMEWTTRKERLEVELARQIPELNLARQLQAASGETIIQALPRSTALVEFVRFYTCDFHALRAQGESKWKATHYAAFVLSAEKPDSVQLFDLGEADEIDEMIARFRESITNETESAAPRQLKLAPLPPYSSVSASNGDRLRRVIFDSLRSALKDCKRLFLAPDGDLARLPFEVLPTEDGSLLIEQYQISYLTTGRDVLRFKLESSGQPTSSLVLADPDFDLSESSALSPGAALQPGPQSRQSRDLDRSSLHFARLPGTRKEGETIAALLGVQPLLGEAALESQLKARCSPRILHIATHGFFLPDQRLLPSKQVLDVRPIAGEAYNKLEWFLGQQVENPLLRSGLALAGANTWNRGGSLPLEAEDGLLTAEDVSVLDLLETELVVLSACETGLGQVHVGEGVFGLRRAFVVAGARTLVMSLWKIPDTHTQELMEEFYSHLLEGRSRVDALRAAQLTMREKHPQPFYWGAFICQGDPAPLPPYQSGTLP